ncbi:Uncharacterised protein [Vibrio cholerae]|nr:Uncharacterised protein [Vibrio cholerae]
MESCTDCNRFKEILPTKPKITLALSWWLVNPSTFHHKFQPKPP